MKNLVVGFNEKRIKIFNFFDLQGGYKTSLPVQTSEGGVNKKYFENQENGCAFCHPLSK